MTAIVYESCRLFVFASLLFVSSIPACTVAGWRVSFFIKGKGEMFEAVKRRESHDVVLVFSDRKLSYSGVVLYLLRSECVK